MTPQRSMRGEMVVTLPSLAWLVAFFLVPVVIVWLIAFKPVDPFGGWGRGWTLDAWRRVASPGFGRVLWRTVWFSLVTTGLCLLLAVPTGYHLACVSARRRRTLLLLIVLPFWVCFLVRIFAWKHLLHPDGFIKHLLTHLRMVSPSASLLYRPGAVLLVMVYTSLPFAILPLYAAAEKFDFGLLEAAMDLGASAVSAWFRVFLPSVRRGVLTAVLMVLIPSLGAYVIPDVVGGPDCEMLGNKIAQRTLNDRNLPLAAALSAVLIVTVLIPLLVIVLRQTAGARGSRALVGERGAP